MPFDLTNYVPVQDRIDAFWKQHPSGRITTELHTWDGEQCVVLARVWRHIDGNTDYGDPDVTGWAQERVASSGVNLTSPVENCETSAIGRALANLGFTTSKSKQRTSQEEMRKARIAEYTTAIDEGGKAALMTMLDSLATGAGMPVEELTQTWRTKRATDGNVLTHEGAMATVPTAEWAAFIVAGEDHLERSKAKP